MPWIVVVPLGVMVLGMAVLFAWQFSRRGMTARSRNPARAGAVWVMFVALIELGMGIGFWVALSKGGGEGYRYAAIALTAVGVIMLFVGMLMRRAGVKKDRILDHGIAGTGRVLNIHQTGVVVNHVPQLAFDLAVTTAMAAAFQATVRSTPPVVALSRLQVGMELPVKVDPADQDEVEIDWEAWVAGGAGSGDAPPGGFSGIGVRPDYTSS